MVFKKKEERKLTRAERRALAIRAGNIGRRETIYQRDVATNIGIQRREEEAARRRYEEEMRAYEASKRQYEEDVKRAEQQAAEEEERRRQQETFAFVQRNAGHWKPLGYTGYGKYDPNTKQLAETSQQIAKQKELLQKQYESIEQKYGKEKMAESMVKDYAAQQKELGASKSEALERAKAKVNKVLSQPAIAPRELYKTETEIVSPSERSGYITMKKIISYPAGQRYETVTNERDVSRYAIMIQASKLAKSIYGKEANELTNEEWKMVEDQAEEDVIEARSTMESGMKNTKLQLLSQLTPESWYGISDIFKTTAYVPIRQMFGVSNKEAIEELGAYMLTTRAETISDIRQHKKWQERFLKGEAPPISESPILYKAAQLGAAEGALSILLPAGVAAWGTSTIRAWRAGKLVSGANIERVVSAGAGTALTVGGYKQVESGIKDIISGKPSGASDIAFGAMMLRTGVPIAGRSAASELVRLSPSYSAGLFGKSGVVKVKVPKNLQRKFKSKEIELKPIPSESITSRQYRKVARGQVIQMHVTKGKLEFKKGFTTIKEIKTGAGKHRTKMGEFYLYTAPPSIKSGKPQSYLFYAGVAAEGKNVKTVSTLEGIYRKFKGEEVVSGKPLFARSYYIDKTPISKLPKQYRKPFKGETKLQWEKRLAKYQKDIAPKMTGVEPLTYIRGGEHQLILPPGTRLAKRKQKIWTTYGNLPILMERLYVMPPKGVKFKKIKSSKPTKIIKDTKKITVGKNKNYYVIQERLRIKPRERERISERQRVMERLRITTRPRLIERPRIMERSRYIERPRMIERPRTITRPRPYERPRMIERPRITTRPRVIERSRVIPRTYYKPSKKRGKKQQLKQTKPLYFGKPKYKPSLVGVLQQRKITKAPLKTTGFDVRGIVSKPRKSRKTIIIKLK